MSLLKNRLNTEIRLEKEWYKSAPMDNALDTKSLT